MICILNLIIYRGLIMILFKEDWDLYPDAIIDLNTRNESALKTAYVFKAMGIENNAFHLQLHDRELSGVNLYKEVSTEIKARAARELAINPWYYFREIAMAPSDGALEPPVFRLNRANVAVYWSFFNHLSSLLIQSRQTGKSLSLDHLYVDLLEFYTLNTTIGLFTKDTGLRVRNIERLKELMDMLPRWLDSRTRADSNNTENITIGALNNKLITAVAQKTKTGAMNVFRGQTLPIIGIDETAFIANIDLSLSTLLPSMTAATDNAERAGLPYGLCMYTTAGFLDSHSGKFVYDNIYKPAAKFTEKLYDCKDRDELYSVVEKNSSNGSRMVLLEYNHNDLGYTDEWLRRKIKDALADGVKAEAEFLLRWTSGKTTSVLSQKVIKILNNSIRTPIESEITPQGYIIDWYTENKEALKNTPFVIGIDSSEAIDSDDIGLVARDYKTGAVLATGKYNMTNLSQFGDFIFWFLQEYKRATLVIEKRSSAMGILDQLSLLLQAVGENIFHRVFNWITNDYKERPDRYQAVLDTPISKIDLLYIKHRKEFGYATASAGRSSRDNLYGDALMSSTKFTGTMTYDKELVNQLVTLEKRNGRVDHAIEAHDDLVIAYLLGYWFLSKGKNLSAYGINPSLVLSNMTITDSEIKNDLKDTLDKESKRLIIEEIIAIIEEIPKLKLPKDIYRAELRIKKLKSKLDQSTIISHNIEAQLEESIKKAKKVKRNNRIF